MDEIDLDEATAEDINELESHLYALVHHESVVFEDRIGAGQEDDNAATESSSNIENELSTTPQPPKKTEERIVTQTRVINNKPSSSGGGGGVVANKRYWNQPAPLQTKPIAITNETPETTRKKLMTQIDAAHTPERNKNKATKMGSPQVMQAIKQSPGSAKKMQQGQRQGQQQTPKKPTQIKQQQQQEQKKQQNTQQKKWPKANTDNVNNISKKPQNLQQKQQQQQQRSKPQTVNQQHKGPFAQQSKKLERFKLLESKKEKAKQARLNKNVRQQKQTIEIINLDSSDENNEDNDDDDDDDVIHVPLSPPEVVNLDDDSSSCKGDNEQQELMKLEYFSNDAPHFLEENALDATDVELNKSKILQKAAPTSNTKRKQVSICNSPTSSVLSSDDFIGQKDRKRLKEDFGSARADDEDLLLLTEDVGTFLRPAEVEQVSMENIAADAATETIVGEEETTTQHDSEPEFVPPCKLDAIKENYRVEPSQFRAMDVYESESDKAESGGVYAKAQSKTPKATVIRPLDSSSSDDHDLNDIEIIEANTSTAQKVKRLRKRRASSTKSDQGEINVNSEDSDSNDNNVSTGLPFISRGIAVERCKSTTASAARKSASQSLPNTRRSSLNVMSDKHFIESLSILAKGEQQQQLQRVSEHSNTDTDDEAENVPTARDIAERVLQTQSSTSNVTVVSTPIELADSDDEADKQMEHAEKEKQTVRTNPVVSKNKTTNAKIAKKQQRRQTVQEDIVPLYETPTLSLLQNEDDKKEEQAEINSKDIVGWNDEMRLFYENSWGGENFNITNNYKRMQNRRQNWQIRMTDRCPKYSPRSNKKCTNCCEFGHVNYKCPRPKKPLVCTNCGATGHLETRCPQAMCLGCGRKADFFVRACNSCSFQRRLYCPLCKMRGHGLDMCPDKWRRYHSTTQLNVPLESDVSYNRVKHCCICSGTGHLAENCRASARFTDYPITSSLIKSNEKVYNDLPCAPNYEMTIVNSLMSTTPFHFKWSKPLTENSYYARFLKIVGLWNRLKRKQNEEKELGVSLPVKKLRPLEDMYVPNPYAKQRKTNEKTATITLPNQVEEISESGNTNVEDEESEKELERSASRADDSFSMHSESISDGAMLEEYTVIDEVGGDEEMEDNNEQEAATFIVAEGSVASNDADDGFKIPKDMECDAMPTSTTSKTTNRTEKQWETNIDSDSNYSFSEHFEVPTSTTSHIDETTEETSTALRRTPVGVLPDMIPLDSNTVAADLEEEQEKEEVAEERQPRRNTRPMGELLDMIPLESGRPFEEENNTRNNSTTSYVSGISMCMNTTTTNQSNDDTTMELLPDVPSQAKIYMQRSDTDYLFSPEGRLFLEAAAKQYNVQVRIDLTSCGYALIIFGLPQDQTRVHMEVLKRCKDVRQKTHEFQSQKPPKRIDILVKYLRDGLCQLLTNLGNVSELFKELKYHEKQNTKNGFKAADKKRRLLNMILIGQAGLLNGKLHVDELLQILKTLLSDFEPDAIATMDMRNEIESHWRMIFTPYEHEDYFKLLQNYSKLSLKNRMSTLNISPQILGQSVLNTALSEEQKTRMMSSGSNSNNNNNSTMAANRQQTTTDEQKAPAAPAFNKQIARTISSNNNNQNNNKNNKSISTPPRFALPKTTTATTNTPSSYQNNKRQQNSTPNQNQNNKRPSWQATSPPCANPQQRSNVNLQLSALLQPNSNNTRFERNKGKPAAQNSSSGSQPNSLRAREPSMFWSCEAMKYIDDCLRLPSNKSDNLARLRRVHAKSRNGQLSYNDYLAVVKLYNTLTGK